MNKPSNKHVTSSEKVNKRAPTKKKAPKNVEKKKRRGQAIGAETAGAGVSGATSGTVARRVANHEAGVGGPALLPHEAAAAYLRMQGEIAAASGEGGRITLHVPTAVTIALGALPNLDALREVIRVELPNVDLGRLAKLRDYALAALYTHLIAIRQADGDEALRPLFVEASPLRERLLRSAELLAYFGAVSAQHVTAIRSGTGYLDAANDLIELARLFRTHWGEVAGRTPITQAEVSRAAELGALLLDALGRRRVGTDGAGQPGKDEEERLRAFWLFFWAYEDARRAVTFLRWYEGDVDTLVPSLFLARRRRASSPDAPADGDADPTPEGPTPESPDAPEEGQPGEAPVVAA
jgi:hypothetical protein